MMADRPPIVLVHGAWHGPWCWQAWADHFRGAGHAVEAVTLPGHDRPGDRRRLWNTMASYVRTVEAAVARSGPDTILVGHSMGGLVGQHVAARRRPLGGLVLLASVPRFGVGPFVLRVLTREAPLRVARVMATASLAPMVETEEIVREGFYSPATPAEVVRDTSDRLQNESFVAMFPMLFRWPRPTRVLPSLPVLVMPGVRDHIFRLAGQRRLRDAYGADYEEMEASGHNVMLDVEWEAAAATVTDWIAAR